MRPAASGQPELTRRVGPAAPVPLGPHGGPTRPGETGPGSEVASGPDRGLLGVAGDELAFLEPIADWTIGSYDIVTLSEFPDDQTATAFLLRGEHEGARGPREPFVSPA